MPLCAIGQVSLPAGIAYPGFCTGQLSCWGTVGFRYELSSDSSIYGKFRIYDCQKYCNVVQLIGHFWLKAFPPQHLS